MWSSYNFWFPAKKQKNCNFFLGHTLSMWRFLDPGSNLRHSRCLKWQLPDSLACWVTKELFIVNSWISWGTVLLFSQHWGELQLNLNRSSALQANVPCWFVSWGHWNTSTSNFLLSLLRRMRASTVLRILKLLLSTRLFLHKLHYKMPLWPPAFL